MRDWPTLPALPRPEAPFVDDTGRVTRDWYRYLTVLDAIVRAVPPLALNDLADVDASAPTDGQQLTWVDADAAWKPGTA